MQVNVATAIVFSMSCSLRASYRNAGTNICALCSFRPPTKVFNAIMFSRNKSGVSSDWIWPNDQYDPVPTRKTRKFRNMLSFEAPRHSRLARCIAYLANRLFYFRLGGSRHGAVTPILPQGELAKLRSIPQGSGNILVSPHPGPLDPQLIFHLVAAAHNGPAVFLMAA